jgi:hypothetical protein
MTNLLITLRCSLCFKNHSTGQGLSAIKRGSQGRIDRVAIHGSGKRYFVLLSHRGGCRHCPQWNKWRECDETRFPMEHEACFHSCGPSTGPVNNCSCWAQPVPSPLHSLSQNCSTAYSRRGAALWLSASARALYRIDRPAPLVGQREPLRRACMNFGVKVYAEI